MADACEHWPAMGSLRQSRIKPGADLATKKIRSVVAAVKRAVHSAWLMPRGDYRARFKRAKAVASQKPIYFDPVLTLSVATRPASARALMYAE